MQKQQPLNCVVGVVVAVLKLSAAVVGEAQIVDQIVLEVVPEEVEWLVLLPPESTDTKRAANPNKTDGEPKIL